MKRGRYSDFRTDRNHPPFRASIFAADIPLVTNYSGGNVAAKDAAQNFVALNPMADTDYWFAKGQKDYPDDWSPPIDEISGLVGAATDSQIEEMKAYVAGWAHARSQAGD